MISQQAAWSRATPRVQSVWWEQESGQRGWRTEIMCENKAVVKSAETTIFIV